MPDLPNSLINPNQLRHYGTVVQDNPTSEEPLHIRTEDASFCMELDMAGTIIFANTTTPTKKELDENPHIILNSSYEWNPSEVKFNISKRKLGHEISAIRNLNFSEF